VQKLKARTIWCGLSFYALEQKCKIKLTRRWLKMKLTLNKRTKEVLKEGKSFYSIDNTKKASILESLNAVDNALNNGNEYSKKYEQILEISKAVKSELKNTGSTKADINNEIKKRVDALGGVYSSLLALRNKNRLTKTVVYEVQMKIVDEFLYVTLKDSELLKEKAGDVVDINVIDTKKYKLSGKKSEVEISLDDFHTGLYKDADSTVANVTKYAVAFGKILGEIAEDVDKGVGIKAIAEAHSQRYESEVARGQEVLIDFLTSQGQL
jgi:hypothetical protein